MIFDVYPYTNFHEMNDDWIIQAMKDLDQKMDDFIAANSLTYADPVEYKAITEYPASTVVTYEGAAYVSKQPVPAGILPTNDEYWLLIFPFEDLIQSGLDDGFTNLTIRLDAYIALAKTQLEAAIADIPAVVNAWLSAHPEATTTVEDGAITWPKLYAELKNVILSQYEQVNTREVIEKTDFVQGDLSGFGVETTSNNACRTGFLYFPEGIIQIRTDSGFVIKVWRYELSGTFEGVSISAADDEWYAFGADHQHKYRITVKRQDASLLAPANLPLETVIFYVWRSKLRGANDPLAALEIVGTSTAVDGLICRDVLPVDYFAEEADPQSYAEAAPYLDGIINSVADGKHLIFTTDRHYRRDSEDTQLLQQYVRSNMNVSRLVFGGDILNRSETPYLAYQIMNEYFDLNAAAFGAAYLPVFGNHDINTANAPDPAATRMNIGVSAELYTRHLDGYAHFETSKHYGNVTGNDIVTIMQTIVDNKIDADSTIPATLGMTRDEIVAAMLEYNKLHYYVDDDINKIRYIVYNTGAPDNIVVQTILGAPGGQTETYLQINWLYETLMSTPEGYDIIMSGHLVTLDPRLTYNSYLNGTYHYDIMAQLSCLKLKAAMNTSITSDMANSINQDWTPTARRSLDFTNAPDVGKIVVLAGHWHRDYACKGYFFQAASGAGGGYSPYDYKGVLVAPGATIDETAGEILIVGTAADKDMTDRQIQLTGVDAVAIDIVTLADELVEFKRIGHSLSYDAGTDTGAHTDPVTRTFFIS